MNKRVKIITHCEEGICPVCGGELNYVDISPDLSLLWHCANCHAKGSEGVDHDTDGTAIFDGMHYDVCLSNGTPVEIEMPAGEPDIRKPKQTVVVKAECKEDICPVYGVPVEIVLPEKPADKKNWKIPVSWEMCGYVHIEAPTLAQAMEKVRNDNDDIPLPEGNYVDGSFCLSYEEESEIRDLHNNGQTDWPK